jgi:hypothetical protein
MTVRISQINMLSYMEYDELEKYVTPLLENNYIV